MKFEELKNKKILITFHINSDIDAVASACILQNILGNNITLSNYGRMDHDAKKLIEFYNKKIEKWENINLLEFEYLIAVDGQNYGMFPHLKNKKVDLLIDHHNSSTEKMQTKNDIIDPNAISTTEIIYSLIKKQNININSETAELILCGIISDSLRYKEVSKNSFLYSEELIKLIKNKYEKLIELSVPRLPKEECIGFINSAKTFKYAIEKEMIIITAKCPSYTGDIATVLSETVADVVFTTAPKEHNTLIKISGRTWVGSGVEITTILKKLEKKYNGTGGGHPYAAGMDFPATPETINKLQNKILHNCMQLSIKEIKKNK
ncbi:DHH family phosphoesterase [Candidatus Micrarchaeota archaeon]|jgi:nanoRNase/pAp phosphatase (c-di-AMP/oligoRNAs hydrolase)|nr:DHH family phosphoesterase [Candidatus Micrarchaeota archaeon]